MSKVIRGGPTHDTLGAQRFEIRFSATVSELVSLALLSNPELQLACSSSDRHRNKVDETDEGKGGEVGVAVKDDAPAPAPLQLSYETRASLAAFLQVKGAPHDSHVDEQALHSV